ncbi:serine hydrolase domain-containing protein [Lactiplantibacillus fabifermentans]|uniref:Beta-lactamase n=2 Tax=Lactiplantibacillus fabifermentans TaxID=483011 RepID=A0A0R2NYK6_9LACO|nr:serine hydrolase domain-containing protein [Lactiplantibacillus fabifermentans]ETY73728.1 beta-lactamase [Lactiplantibacillus fabifermentans T30PCM01]KRO29344.1 beta-lactamase [Lactiplantibacillus fabifermentans DSM 21115]
MAFEQSKQVIQQMVAAGVIPGASYAVMHGQAIQAAQVGVAQLQPTEKPLWPHALYDLASVTKVVGTTTLALQLMAAGQLDIKRPVHDYLPAFKNRQVTILNLMTHTSGLSGYIQNRNALPADQLLAAIQALPVSAANLNHRVVYTDLGLILTGLIIEQLVGEPIQDAITKRVLTPLQLPDATFTPQSALAVPTTYSPQAGLRQGVVHDPKAAVLGAHCGSAGLFASTADLIKFAQLMLGQIDVPTVLDQTTIASLYHDWTPNHELRRSFGWNLWRRGEQRPPVIFHTGYTGTLFMLDRQSQSALVFLSNRVHPTVRNSEFLPARRRLIAAWLADTDKF